MNTKLLRQTILDRAIRGLLVPQDPTDEPASVLLERIRAEKEQLIKDKKLKREKKDTQPIEEVPFEIPEGWVWCRLGEIQQVITGSTPTKKNNKLYGNDYPFYKPTDLDQAYYVVSAINNLSSLGYEGSRKLPKKSILITCIGATIGKTGFIRREGTCNQQINAILPNNNISSEYSYFVCISSFFQNNIVRNASATTLPILNKSKFEDLFFPLPPLAEQHRIVQKIEQLFVLIDIIEVNKKALEKLIEQAKSQVLSDAIAGKLTRQDPNDEPAEELLKRIGKTTAPDTPYEKMLPKGWAWCRGNQILNPMESQKPLGEKFDYIDISSIDNRQNKITEIKTIAVTEAPSRASRKVKFGDTLFSMVRPYLRNIAFVDKKYSNCIASTGFYVCTPNKTLFPKYLFYLMISDYVVQGLNKYMKGDNSPSINNEDITNFIFSLPPLAEQYRIVKKIETYFAAFDKIKNELI